MKHKREKYDVCDFSEVNRYKVFIHVVGHMSKKLKFSNKHSVATRLIISCVQPRIITLLPKTVRYITIISSKPSQPLCEEL